MIDAATHPPPLHTMTDPASRPVRHRVLCKNHLWAMDRSTIFSQPFSLSAFQNLSISAFTPKWLSTRMWTG